MKSVVFETHTSDYHIRKVRHTGMLMNTYFYMKCPISRFKSNNALIRKRKNERWSTNQQLRTQGRYVNAHSCGNLKHELTDMFQNFTHVLMMKKWRSFMWPTNSYIGGLLSKEKSNKAQRIFFRKPTWMIIRSSYTFRNKTKGLAIQIQLLSYLRILIVNVFHFIFNTRCVLSCCLWITVKMHTHRC